MRLRCQRRQNHAVVWVCVCTWGITFIHQKRSQLQSIRCRCRSLRRRRRCCLCLGLCLCRDDTYQLHTKCKQLIRYVGTGAVDVDSVASLDALLSKFRFRLKRIHYLSLLLLFPCAFPQTSSVSCISFALDSALYGSGSDQADIVGRARVGRGWIGR